MDVPAVLVRRDRRSRPARLLEVDPVTRPIDAVIVLALNVLLVWLLLAWWS